MLVEGDLEVLGRMPWSSNATFLVEACHEGVTTRGVYKPARGERPLWDFPSGLYTREVAAFRLSAWLGWDLVPYTVVRDGPLGVGSVQAFVDADFDEHYFTLFEAGRNLDELRRICAFDLVANNTDRKSGHCLLGTDGQVHAIDNGLSFHREFKLRTVIWDFAGEPIPDDIVRDVARLADHGAPDELDGLLDRFELDAVRARARALAEAATFPADPTGQRWPWPLV